MGEEVEGRSSRGGARIPPLFVAVVALLLPALVAFEVVGDEEAEPAILGLFVDFAGLCVERAAGGLDGDVEG